MELRVSLATLLGRGKPEWEFYPSPEVLGVSVSRASEESCPQREMIQREVPHVADPYHIEAASVQSENVVTSRPEDGSLPDLEPSLQVLGLTALVEVADQVYETVLREEVRHLLDPQAPFLVKVHVQVPNGNGVLETFEGLLQVWQVLEHRQG